jgi:hypothetical protein
MEPATSSVQNQGAGHNLRLLLLIGFGIVFILGFLYYFYIFLLVDIGPKQPVAFSHQVHSGVKEIQCQFCHPYVAKSKNPGMPPVEKCLYCHHYILHSHPEILKEHDWFEAKTPAPWIKVNYLAEHVFFNHQRHIRKEIECKECHGAVETMDRLNSPKFKFKMGFCIECHIEKKANLDCWSCHN